MKQTTGLRLTLFSLLLVMLTGNAGAAVGIDLDTSVCIVAADDDNKDGDTKKEGEEEPDCD